MGALDQAVGGNWKTTRPLAGQPKGSGGDGNPISKNGYDKGELVSALQKAIRRGQEAQALYWAQELMESNETWRMWRRLVVIAAEDVGLADPDMVPRIMAMKQAHDMGREANIPFLAVMLLCRAPKNREADDACYLYELKFKRGWKIPMPPEAVDGHTRRGRTELYRMAQQQGTDWEDLWNREFYYDVALLDKYVEVETGGEKEFYRKALMRFIGLPYDTYDIGSCKQPRIRSGGIARQVSNDLLSAKVASDVQIREIGDENGELIDNAVEIQSMTTKDVWYRVEIGDVGSGSREPISCSCPAFSHNDQGMCKHLLAVRRWLTAKAAEAQQKKREATRNG